MDINLNVASLSVSEIALTQNSQKPGWSFEEALTIQIPGPLSSYIE